MKIILSIVLVTGLAVMPVFAQDSTPTPVPAEYQALYSTLDTQLTNFQTYLDSQWDGSGGNTTFGAELITANGNRGEALLDPLNLVVTDLYLERLQAMGIGGVTVQISYPLLRSDFPRSDEYLDFYRQVGQMIHQRGMTFLVETGPTFPDPEFSNLQVDFSSLTVEQYFADQRQLMALIASEIQPDYLSITSEPETEMMLTGLSFTVDTYLEHVQTTLAGIDRSTGILVGGGSGTWENPLYLQQFIEETDFDFINFHVYPMIGPNGGDFLKHMLATAAYAKAYGKQLIIGESWLYKVSPQEMQTGISYRQAYARDYYSFWHPLDSRFIEALVGVAHYQGFAYVSFFWAGYFFAYADYATSEDTPQLMLVSQLRQTTFENIRNGVLSETGQIYQQLIAGN